MDRIDELQDMVVFSYRFTNAGLIYKRVATLLPDSLKAVALMSLNLYIYIYIYKCTNPC